MRGFSAIGLFNTKFDQNIGGVLRAAHCYGATMVAVEGGRFKKTNTNTTKAERHLPVLEVNSLLNIIPYGCEPIVIELTPRAVSLVNFTHPHAAFYIFGPEDGNVPIQFLKYRQVKVPTNFCMNLAATVNVVLYDRMSKQIRAK